MRWRLLLLFAAPWFGAAVWATRPESKPILCGGREQANPKKKKKKKKRAGGLRGGGGGVSKAASTLTIGELQKVSAEDLKALGDGLTAEDLKALGDGLSTEVAKEESGKI